MSGSPPPLRNWDRHLSKFASALRTTTHDFTSKTSVCGVINGMKIPKPYEQLTFTEDEVTKKEKSDFDTLITETQRILEKSQMKQAKY